MGDLYGQVSQRRRRRRVTIGLAVVVVLAVVATGWWWTSTRTARAELAAAQRLVAELTVAWEQRDLSAVRASGGGLHKAFTAATRGLGEASATVEPGPVVVDDAGAVSDLDVTWAFPGELVWSYSTVVQLVRTEDGQPLWEVDWTPASLHPKLHRGERLVAARQQPDRGDIQDVQGNPIVTERPVVNIGVQPSRVSDLDQLTADLARVLEIDGPALADRVTAASSDAFVPVITLREQDYAAVEDQVYPLPGTVFQRDTQPLAPTAEFARAFLGSVGEVTAEQLQQHPGRYRRGDAVGRSGLQRALDERLRGTAGLTVAAVADDAGERRVLYEVPAEAGQDVTVTLRERVQRAADAVLAEVEHPSALVAIDVPTGDVVTVANGPAAGFDIATAGQYPPGSAFKVVTSTRLLNDGLRESDTVPCPGTATVEGRSFGNAEDAELGDVSFATAFAQSCNTAFVELSRGMQPGDLQETAGQHFGIGARGGLGIGAFAGSVPSEQSAVEIAAAAIGQGRVLVSPLIAADIAATVARGNWRQPRLLVKPSTGEQRAGDDLPNAAVLQQLTRAVVTDGSGEAVAGLAGEPVHGKTGTAEYGNEDPPRTHAWFIGYQGDLAFAVLVAETADSFGGQVAAPIAAKFLTALR